MSSETPKKRMGRPRKYPGTEKRPTLTFRVRDGLHEKLKQSSEDGERSISEEIERRLERSYEIDKLARNACSNTIDTLEALFGGPQMMRFTMDLSYGLRQALGRERATADEFKNNREVRAAVLRNLFDVLPNFFDFAEKNAAPGMDKTRELIMINFNAVLDGLAEYEAASQSSERTPDA